MLCHHQKSFNKILSQLFINYHIKAFGPFPTDLLQNSASLNGLDFIIIKINI